MFTFKMKFIIKVAAVVVLLLQEISAIPVCYRTQHYYIQEGYRTVRYCRSSNNYICGIRWRGFAYCTRYGQYRCDTTLYRPKVLTRSVTSCCSHFTGNYPNCRPICNPSCVNGRCAYSEVNSNNYCACNAGWTGAICDTDVNECNSGSKLCHDLARCVNTAGSYRCQCQSGYVFASDGFTCVDSNECSSGNHICLDDVYCHNTVGDYFCTCPSGYLKDTNDIHLCNDINECSVGNGGCQQACVNTNGSYYCDCQSGYSLNADNATCSDINECIEGTHNCSRTGNNFCINTIGSFICQCDEGYQHGNPQDACTDIDECSNENGACSQICNNTVGSYFCSCSAGYELSGTHVCNDINECLGDHGCQQICINFVGGYRCDCRLGFTLNDNNITCRLQECLPHLVTPLHGNLSCPDGQVTNTSCDTSCNPGYELTESAKRTCQPNGSWSFPPAICTPMKCPRLSQPENGYIRSPCLGTYGSVCILQCFYGFEVTNGSSQLSCDLTVDESGVKWSDYGTCERKPVCNDDTCTNGKCVEISDTQFYCNCTGTLYTGNKCDRGLIVVPDIGELQYSSSVQLQITVAAPNDILTLILRNPCTLGGGGLFITPCKMVFSPSETTGQSRIIGGHPGIHYMTFKLEGADAISYKVPQPVPIIVGSGRSSDYFTKLNRFSPFVYSSCCELSLLLSHFRCGTNPRDSIQFTSSCSWKRTGSYSVKTNGIVFSRYKNLSLPVSVAGIAMSKTDLSTVSLSIPSTESFQTCDDCKDLRNDVSAINSDDTCYKYLPQSEDFRQFTARQSLIRKFLVEVQANLMPDWLNLTVPDDPDALRKIVEADYRVSIGSESEVRKLQDCEFLILDKKGYFSVLLHNGPLNFSLSTSTLSIEQHSISVPKKGSFYCFAVQLCSGDASPVYLSIPQSLQAEILNVGFLKKYLRKGWTFKMQSFIFWRNIVKISNISVSQYWNGLVHDYIPPMQESDVSIKMASTGSFTYKDTNASFYLDGSVSYKYTLKRNEPDTLMAFGKHSLLVNTMIKGKIESLSLKNLSSPVFIFHNDPVTFSCSATTIPQSGISFKLSYRVESTGGFFYSFFQLPYDTPQCPVDVFINLNSVKEMNGLSFYSSCLELIYDSLVFAMLSHKFYIPMDSRTLCVNPQDFTDHFSSPIIYGLWTQSSLYPTDLSYYQLNPLFKILPGSSRVTVTLGFYKSTNEKVGLIHSVEIAVLDGILVSPIALQNSGLSFSGSTVIYNSHLYFVQLKGTAPTTIPWAKMNLLLEGWFPHVQGGFLMTLEEDVRRHLQHVANRASVRLGIAADDVSAANDAVSIYAVALNEALNQYIVVKQNYQTRLKEKNKIEAELIEAEEDFKNATSELKMVEEAMENLCEINTCVSMCAATSRFQIVVKDVYKNETVPCTSYCPVQSYQRLPPYYVTVSRWGWVRVCYSRIDFCDLYRACIYERCRSVCYPSRGTSQIPHYNYVPYTYNRPCDKECLQSIFVGRRSTTELVVDECGTMLPDASCVRRNELCQKQRQSALTLIDEKRRGITEPLRHRNLLKQQMAVAENKLLKAALAKERARDRVMRAETQAEIAEKRYNSTLLLQQSIRKSDDIGYKANEFLRSMSDVTDAFTITNISFNVLHSSDSTPYNFPVTIEYRSGGLSHFITRQYYFKTSYKSQKDAIVEAIIDDMLEKRSGQDVTGRRKRADEVEVDGEREFQNRCVHLKSLQNFLNDIYKALIASNHSLTMLKNNLASTLAELYYLNSSLHSGNVSVNYTQLQNTFNISSEAIDRARNESETDLDDELASYMEVLDDLIKDAQETALFIEADAVIQWRRDLTLSFEGNFTLGKGICYGLKDCILVFSAEIVNMLDFAPLSITDTIAPLVPEATESLLLISSNTSNTFSEIFSYLVPIMNITDAMDKSGYWCAQRPSIVTTPMKEVNVSVSEALVLTCLGQSLLPLSYQWRKDGIVIKNANQSTFVLENIQVFDEGNYSCDITNEVGSINTTNASVHTYQTPQFYLTPVSLVSYAGDQKGALFTCNATSRPDPGWKWFHRSSVSDDWKEIAGEETNELFISRPLEKDDGWYFCMAINYHGNISSDPVYLRIMRVTAKVNSLPISFELEKSNDRNIVDKRNTASIRSLVMKYLKEKADINSSFIRDLIVSSIDEGETYQVSFYLLSYNATVTETGLEPLANIAEKLQNADIDLMKKRNKIKQSIDRKELLVGEGTYYSPVESSFTVQHTNILCPSGKKLHSNTFLCIDCLEGEHQVTVEIVREIEGQVLREMTPICTLCPEDTYQDKPGGGECIPCPANHITSSSGATSKDDCVALCSPHTYSNNGLAPCKKCPRGEYQPEYGETYCITCLSEKDNPACAPNPCELSKDIGNCRDLQTKVYYDVTKQQCLAFVYTGCGGNINNFNNFVDCSTKCGCPNNGTLHQCATNPCITASCSNFPYAKCLIDYCDGCKARFYYDGREVTDICSCPKTYSLLSCPSNCTSTCQTPNPIHCTTVDCIPSCGCAEGTVLDVLSGQCIPPTSCDTCSLPVSVGPCKGSYPRWFYNSTSRQCQLFSYGGCGGNSNRFTSLASCTEKCGCPQNQSLPLECSVDPCKVSECPSYPNSVCEIDKCVDEECMARHFSFFTDVTSQCGDTCALQADAGTCDSNVTRWFFNKETKRCEQFLYTGCNGNRNNFLKLSDCLNLCVLCQAGVSEVSCDTDLCENTHCTNHPKAICVTNNCGTCTFSFFNTTGHDVTNDCYSCPQSKAPVFCPVSPCDHQNCYNYPEAICTTDVCGQCKAKFSINGTDVTESCGTTCPYEGQVFKECKSCQQTCKTIMSKQPVVCSPFCEPGCECPTGLVFDEELDTCVSSDDCLCPDCEELPENCSNIIRSNNDNCSCPICRDCHIKGQVYQETGSCPKTCQEPHRVCLPDASGCTCPNGHLIDEVKGSCVKPEECSKLDPCSLQPYKGPCNSQIQRYFYNSTSQKCEVFYFGGCYPNGNNFFNLHDCEKKCSACPPTCTIEFCAINRGAVCTIGSLDISNSTAADCPKGCPISNCWACYYSYIPLPYPDEASTCSSSCSLSVDGLYEKSCMQKWGRCILFAYTNTYREILKHERIASNFKCWSYPCRK